MIKYLIVLALMVPLTGSAQKKIQLKRKFLGTYIGTIPAYKIESDDELLFVSQSDIKIEIGKNQVQITVGGNQLYGSYEVMFEAQKYYLLDVKVEGQLATERIMVYKRGKHLSRDGMFPQPVTDLYKAKKRR
jgi:hypothetical protein